MSAEKEEINKLLEQVYQEIGKSCRHKFQNIGKVMQRRREAIDFSVWQIGMKTENAFRDIELIEKGGYFDEPECDYQHFYQLLENIIQLNDIYSYYEENPDVLEIDRLYKQEQDNWRRHTGN